MPIRVAVPKEVTPGENRVALVPSVAKRLSGEGIEVLVQKGAGAGTYCTDEEFAEFAKLVDSAEELYRDADVVLKVQPPTEEEIGWMKDGAVVVGLLVPNRFMLPERYPQQVKALQDRKITAFAMELVPRISRAQAMDALSSQASVAGYKAALMAADRTARFFPMLTTAAGTIRPAKVLVIGAGVAGLQAIATSKRLGAQVEAYDVRAATKEQVQSLGAKFIELDVQAEAEGGYARELTEEEKKQQQELLAQRISVADAVITTASVPGRPAPRIITKEMVEGMKPGSVIVDLGAEGGGNCELTKPGEEVLVGGTIVYGPINVPSQLPAHASEMYAKNLQNFMEILVQEGELKPDADDEILVESALTRNGEIPHEPTRKLVEGGEQ